MKKFRELIILLAVSLVVAGCATTGDSLSMRVPEPELESVLDIYNEYAGTVYLGISGPYTDDETASKQAMKNCARSIAFNEALSVKSDIDSRNTDGSGYETFKVSSEAFYSGKSIGRILDEMEIIEMARGDRETGVYCLATYRGSQNKAFDYVSMKDDAGRPKWITNPPKIKGYQVSVGMTEEYYYLQDSLEAAAFQGAVQIMFDKADSVFANASVTSSGSKGENGSLSQDIYQIGVNFLKEFTVLEYWYDRENRDWYALVAAKDGE